ncbi:MAG: helix-turn-helix domain-containing protein [Fusobacteriaceae bacterium]
MKYSEFLKSKRIELGYSTRKLGSKIGVSGSYISLVENAKTTTPPTEEMLKKMVEGLKLTPKEESVLYDLIDKEVLPQRVKNKLEKLEKELSDCRNQLNIESNSNNGHIIVGDGNKINHSYAGTELCKELNELSEKQRGKVLKFINEYIK